eukprot:Skav228086  [mRNA]  locus=scaffold913:356672:357799:- [translate_table: standard]
MVNGECLEFSAQSMDTVRRLKAQLEQRIGVPAHQQRLLHGTQDQLLLCEAQRLDETSTGGLELERFLFAS